MDDDGAWLQALLKNSDFLVYRLLQVIGHPQALLLIVADPKMWYFDSTPLMVISEIVIFAEMVQSPSLASCSSSCPGYMCTFPVNSMQSANHVARFFRVGRASS